MLTIFIYLRHEFYLLRLILLIGVIVFFILMLFDIVHSIKTKVTIMEHGIEQFFFVKVASVEWEDINKVKIENLFIPFLKPEYCIQISTEGKPDEINFTTKITEAKTILRE